MAKKRKPTLCIDFDGVINSYKTGWHGPRKIPDPPVEGAIEWLGSLLGTTEEMSAMLCEASKFEVCIFSSRNQYFGAKRAMKKWFLKHGMHPGHVKMLQFPRRKPPAHLILDDRAMQFNGTFPTIEEMSAFRPWYRRRAK